MILFIYISQMNSFSTFLEHDAVRKMFGFPEPKPPLALDPEGGPIKMFGREKLMSELAHYRVGPTTGVKLLGEVRWGEGSGAVRVRLSPNYLVMVERLTDDLNGNSVWVCKRTAKVKVGEFSGEEPTVAVDIAKQVSEVADTAIDAAQSAFKMDPLIKRLVEKVKRLSGPFIYERTNRSGPDWYTILFGTIDSGVGQLVRQTRAGTTPAGLLEVAFMRNRGVVKGIFTTIGVSGTSGQWQLQVPYFTGEFVPTQPLEEIASILFSGIRLIREWNEITAKC